MTWHRDSGLSRISIVALAASAALFATPPTAGAGEGADMIDPAATYRDQAARLIGEAIVSNHAYDNLEYLCDRIGNRLSGSTALEEAVQWAADLMKREGLSNVRLEEVPVPVWVRGAESARIVTPVSLDLNLLGLGMSVGTPPGGIEAEVVVVRSFDELDTLGEDGVSGKIVLYDVPYEGYGATVTYRMDGPSRAGALGAVAALVRSIGPISYDTPHTGTLRYSDDAPKIPAAAITIENSALIGRLVDNGEKVTIHLEMEARTLDDAISANVIGEIPGSEKPGEIVLRGAHLDSWDVGQGAQDDGVGCVIALEAARLIGTLGLSPRRTIRVVFFTNEENGTRGGKKYLEEHGWELSQHVAAIESDSGNGPAEGFHLDLRAREGRDDGEAENERAEALATMRSIGSLLELTGSSTMKKGWSGVDIGPIVAAGVVGLGLAHDTSAYFNVHHTRADTFEKIDRGDLAKNVAAMAVMAYVLADMPERLAPPATNR